MITSELLLSSGAWGDGLVFVGCKSIYMEIMFIYIYISNAGIFRADDVITFQTGTLKYADTYVPQMVFICNFKI